MARLHLLVSAEDAYVRGRQRATRLRAAIRSAIRSNERRFFEHGVALGDMQAGAEQTFEAIRAWNARYADEMLGIADGVAEPIWKISALNASAEILLSLGCLPADHGVVSELLVGDPDDEAQSWTWLGDLAPKWHTQAVSGGRYSYVGATEAGVLSRIAVNSNGLAAFVSERAQTVPSAAAVPMHVWLAALVENCGSVAEGQQFMAAMPQAEAGRVTLIDGVHGCMQVESGLRPTNGCKREAAVTAPDHESLVTAVAMPETHTLLVLDRDATHSAGDGWIELVAERAA
jgi:isopenicillin-N N-acyltransferase-like protein